MLKRSFKAVPKTFSGSFKERFSVCSRKFEKKASRVFQECFHEILFDKFVVAWISSQLPEQKEGLFQN